MTTFQLERLLHKFNDQIAKGHPEIWVDVGDRVVPMTSGVMTEVFDLENRKAKKREVFLLS